MTFKKIFQRFFIASPLVTLIYYLKFKCMISPRAEVELSPNLRIGTKTKIGSFTKIKATDGPLTIGSNVSIGTNCFIASHEKGLRIGHDCLVSPNVTIIATNYNYGQLDIPFVQQGTTSKGIEIGDNVWLGSGVCVVDGAKIGKGVIVTPNSVVTTDVADYSIIQGNPAKLIFTRR